MNARLIKDAFQLLNEAFPGLGGLWYIVEDRHPQCKGNMIELFACDVSDYISEHDGVYRTCDYVSNHAGTLEHVIAQTASWKALARVQQERDNIAAQLRKAVPITLFGIECKYLGVFDIIPGHSHGIITLKHDILGVYYARSSNTDMLRELDATLARIAAE